MSEETYGRLDNWVPISAKTMWVHTDGFLLMSPAAVSGLVDYGSTMMELLKEKLEEFFIDVNRCRKFVFCCVWQIVLCLVWRKTKSCCPSISETFIWNVQILHPDRRWGALIYCFFFLFVKLRRVKKFLKYGQLALWFIESSAVIKNSCLDIFPLPLRDELRKLVQLKNENFFNTKLDWDQT